MFENYKGRVIDPDHTVDVYRNLHRPGYYSVRQRGLVVGHAKEITLRNVTFIVNKNGQERVRREKKKYVHAYVRGFFDSDTIRVVNGRQVYYNPYTTDRFVFKDDPTSYPLLASFVSLGGSGIVKAASLAVKGSDDDDIPVRDKERGQR